MPERDLARSAEATLCTSRSIRIWGARWARIVGGGGWRWGRLVAGRGEVEDEVGYLELGFQGPLSRTHMVRSFGSASIAAKGKHIATQGGRGTFPSEGSVEYDGSPRWPEYLKGEIHTPES